MKEVGRNQVEFFYGIEGVDVAAPAEAGYKINAVEGNKCYKKNYRYAFNRKVVALGQGELSAVVDEVIDYGNQKYAKLSVGEQKLLVEVPADFADKELKIEIKGSDIEVWQQEIDFRIC